MRKKQPVQFSQKFPNADPSALRLLERLLAFDPKDRPTAEEVILVLDYELLHSMFCHFSFIVISHLLSYLDLILTTRIFVEIFLFGVLSGTCRSLF